MVGLKKTCNCRDLLFDGLQDRIIEILIENLNKRDGDQSICETACAGRRLIPRATRHTIGWIVRGFWVCFGREFGGLGRRVCGMLLLGFGSVLSCF